MQNRLHTDPRKTTTSRLFGVLISILLLASACSGAGNGASAEDEATATTTTTAPAVDDTTSTTTTEPEPVDTPEELTVTNEFSPLEPGLYTTDVLRVEMTFRTDAEWNVFWAEPGKVGMQAIDTGADYFGIAFFDLDTLLSGNGVGLISERIPATANISEFLSGVESVDVTDQGEGSLGGLSGRWWEMSWADPVDCCNVPLLRISGWENAWGLNAGNSQTLWVLETPDGLMAVSIIAPTGELDRWNEEVAAAVFTALEFGEPTPARPLGVPVEAIGDYSVGQLETVFVDTTRPTPEIMAGDANRVAGVRSTDSDLVLVPASDERRLLISVVYPAEADGHGAAVAVGQHPLLLFAHALGDGGQTLPAQHALASRGYVVATVRFPEAANPGGSVIGVPEQPVDMSFVLDQVETGGLGAALTEQIDFDRIGALGESGGGTTVIGLGASDTVADDRFGAIVSHAPALFDFDSGVGAPPAATSTAPLLLIGSEGDLVAPPDGLQAIQDSWDTDVALAVFEVESHLAWLDPTSNAFTNSLELVDAFFDNQLRDGENDLAAIAAEKRVRRIRRTLELDLWPAASTMGSTKVD